MYECENSVNPCDNGLGPPSLPPNVHLRRVWRTTGENTTCAFTWKCQWWCKTISTLTICLPTLHRQVFTCYTLVYTDTHTYRFIPGREHPSCPTHPSIHHVLLNHPSIHPSIMSYLTINPSNLFAYESIYLSISMHTGNSHTNSFLSTHFVAKKSQTICLILSFSSFPSFPPFFLSPTLVLSFPHASKCARGGKQSSGSGKHTRVSKPAENNYFPCICIPAPGQRATMIYSLRILRLSVDRGKCRRLHSEWATVPSAGQGQWSVPLPLIHRDR